MIDLTQKLTGVIRTVGGKIRADEDTPKSESVSFHLEIDYSDCTIEDVITYASADRKIAWATSGRKAVGKLTNGQLIKIKASSPGTRTQDPMEVLAERAKASGRSLVEQFEYERKQRGM